jgi:hypothetical protein
MKDHRFEDWENKTIYLKLEIHMEMNQKGKNEIKKDKGPSCLKLS